MKTLLSTLLCAAAMLLVSGSLRNNQHANTRPADGAMKKWLLPSSATTSVTVARPDNQPLAPTVNPNWIINSHGECCEGNSAAQGQSFYVLLPVLINGNKILRSDDGGMTWVRKYPPVDVSVPFGIEGDLNAFGDDVVYFGTQVADGVCARSTDRGETWTVVQIPVGSAGNDQAWSYLGPFNVSPAQTAPYVLTGWFRIGSVALFSLDGGLTWPIQTPLIGIDGSGPDHVVCHETAHPPTSPGDTRIPDANFVNHKAGRHGGWGTDKKFYWADVGGGSLYVCKTDNFGATWSGIQHPIAPGPGAGEILTTAGFDNKGTLYVLHGDKLYVSFNQGESFAFVHTVPIYADGQAADGANEFFVANCGTVHIGLAQQGAGVNNIWYVRGNNVDTATPTWDQELADTPGNNRLDFMQIVLNGNNVPMISYTDSAGDVRTASRIAPFPGGTTCGLPCVTGAVSRKTHGAAGTFDVILPPTGNPGIECRTGGATGSHQIVISFCNAVTSVGSVTTSCGTVQSSSTSGNAVTVNLTGVPNAQCCTITLHNVADSVTVGDVTISACFLLGDTTANRAVNASDVSQAKSQSGTTTNASNFRTDVTVNGVINSSDISLVKSKSGTALPP